MRLARASRQLSLLDVPPVFKMEKNAQARNAYGRAAQEIVCAALGLSEIPINGSCEVCFDAEKEDEDGEDTFFEIKSVHRCSGIPLYDWRAQKDADAEREGNRVFYAILRHGLKGERDGSRIIQAMEESKPAILICRAELVRTMAAEYPLRQLYKPAPETDVPRMGYQRKGYRLGYRNLPCRQLLNRLVHFGEVKDFTLHGVNFQIPIYRES